MSVSRTRPVQNRRFIERETHAGVPRPGGHRRARRGAAGPGRQLLRHVDDDGKSDLQTVKNLITMNGGVVDCYVTDEGQRGGNLTNDTRYLVLGDAPDETSTEARRNARRDLLNDAEQRGLMKITLRDLLDKMGWKNQTPVVHFGREANPNDFRPLPPEGGPKTSSGTVSPLFQPREPLRGSRGSAY